MSKNFSDIEKQAQKLRSGVKLETRLQKLARNSSVLPSKVLVDNCPRFIYLMAKALLSSEATESELSKSVFLFPEDGTITWSQIETTFAQGFDFILCVQPVLDAPNDAEKLDLLQGKAFNK